MSQITFGIELEFILATLPPNNPDPSPLDTRQAYNIVNNTVSVNGAQIRSALPRETDETVAQYTARIKWLLRSDLNEAQLHIASTLASAGYPATTDYEEWLRVDRMSKSGEGLGGEEYLKWHVGTDSSIVLPEDQDGYKYFQIELKSRKLQFSDAAIEEVKTVLGLVADRYRVSCNTTCGLHVHIAQGSKGLPSIAIKNLMIIIWAFEDRLELLHPPSRRSKSVCPSLHAATSQTVFQGLTEAQKLDKLFACEDGDAVLDLLGGSAFPKTVAYHAWRLRATCASGGLRTVEFRQAAGRFDLPAAENWIKVCERLVTYAIESQEDDLGFERWVRERVVAESFGVLRLLEDLGLNPQKDYYETVLGEAEII